MCNKIKAWFGLIIFFVVIISSVKTAAHEIRPAYLEINEDSLHRISALWKQPTQGEVAVKLIPHLSSGILEVAPTNISSSHAFLIKEWMHLSPGKQRLEGQKITIEGLEATITDVLVVVNLADGKSYQQIIRPQDPTFTIKKNLTGTLPAMAYLYLGVEHILTGIDHLIFVLGLLLLVKSRSLLIKTITSFTIAHSITLSAATLGLVSVQPSVVEAVIALSIMFLAVELANSYKGRNGLTIYYPWIIAFTFGLLHGFGFAGALTEVGLPKDNIPLSLLLFNVGVEIGQLFFVAGVLALIWVLQRLPFKRPQWTQLITPYAIGSFAAFWFLQRILIILE